MALNFMGKTRNYLLRDEYRVKVNVVKKVGVECVSITLRNTDIKRMMGGEPEKQFIMFAVDGDRVYFKLTPLKKDGYRLNGDSSNTCHFQTPNKYLMEWAKKHRSIFSDLLYDKEEGYYYIEDNESEVSNG